MKEVLIWTVENFLGTIFVIMWAMHAFQQWRKSRRRRLTAVATMVGGHFWAGLFIFADFFGGLILAYLSIEARLSGPVFVWGLIINKGFLVLASVILYVSLVGGTEKADIDDVEDKEIQEELTHDRV